MAFCDAIRAARLAAGLSQVQLAARLGSSQTDLSRVERNAPTEAGRGGISEGTMLRIAGALRMSVLDLIAHDPAFGDGED
jgi:transcriptional regulator with XRE-family HTH domain